MRKFGNRLRSRSAARFLPLLVGLFVTLAMFGMRLITRAEWNSWANQFMWHALESKHAHELSSSIPEGDNRARIWLAQDALAGGNTQRALVLVEPVAIQNDPFALYIQAVAMERQGNFAGALQTLIRARDYNLLIELGDNAARANDQVDALAAYNAALAIDSEMGVLPLANYLTAKKGDLIGAETVLRRALATYPVSSQRLSWYHSLGNNLRSQKRYDEAEAVYQTALVENPNDWATHIALGWVYYERGDGVQSAIEEFQKAIAMEETRGDGYYAIAQALTREKRYVEADDWYRLAIEHDATNRGIYIARGNNARSGDLDMALSIYQETVKLFPDYPSVYYEMAWAYRLNNQPEEAQENIEKALSLMNPPNEWYYVRAEQIFEWSGEIGRALEAYRSALEINPSNASAQQVIRDLGNNLRSQKRYDKAEAVYQAALAENPSDWASCIGLGWVYYERGDEVQAAIEEFQKTIAMDEMRGDGYHAVAQVLTREKRYVEADDWYRLAIEHDATNRGIYIARGNNARSFDLDMALSIYQETARLFPDYPSVYYEMAWAYRLNNQPEEAQENIEKALSLMTSPNEWYYVRAGQIFEWSGDLVRALDAYRKALTINPDNSTAQQGVSRLGGP
jgi:tetratricopeptide (TPR) repeat protein